MNFDLFSYKHMFSSQTAQLMNHCYKAEQTKSESQWQTQYLILRRYSVEGGSTHGSKLQTWHELQLTWAPADVSLWMDKYCSCSLGQLDYHKDQATQLHNLVQCLTFLICECMDHQALEKRQGLLPSQYVLANSGTVDQISMWPANSIIKFFRSFKSISFP